MLRAFRAKAAHRHRCTRQCFSWVLAFACANGRLGSLEWSEADMVGRTLALSQGRAFFTLQSKGRTAPMRSCGDSVTHRSDLHRVASPPHSKVTVSHSGHSAQAFEHHPPAPSLTWGPSVPPRVATTRTASRLRLRAVARVVVSISVVSHSVLPCEDRRWLPRLGRHFGDAMLPEHRPSLCSVRRPSRLCCPGAHLCIDLS